MGDKVKIEVRLNSTDKIVETVGWGILGFLWILTILGLFIIPETIPTHFNSVGKADGFGEKETIIFLPILATIILFTLTKLNQYPQFFNFPTKLMLENTEQQYASAMRMIRYLKVSLAIVFTALVFGIIQSSQGKMDGLGNWFLPFLLILIFIPTIYFIGKSLKDK
ncbi:MAG: hypothetical protein RLZZ306_1687 [Bacteroidota bacterium]